MLLFQLTGHVLLLSSGVVKRWRCDQSATQSIGYLVAPEHIVIAIAAMNPQTRDPLIRLPYETWLQCLSLAIQDSADGPLPYLAVSPHWSETILSSPALWTQIIINNGEDEEARLHTFLHLSASQLLDMHRRQSCSIAATLSPTPNKD
jgi:hypothetical protein